MSVTRANVEATKRFIGERVGNPYVYGGALSPTNVHQGTDCSEVWQTVLEMIHGRYQPGRQSEGATTESYRRKRQGGSLPDGVRGPFGTVDVNHWSEIPADAAVKLAFHHGPGGGANSHMWGELDGMLIESAGSKGLVTNGRAMTVDNSYATAWAYLPGPIVEDGTPPADPLEPRDTLYADVSEWQVPVDDSYPYSTICIRSNDGTHKDLDWAHNYDWCKRNADSGKLKFFMVYFVWRPNWQDAVRTLKEQIGTPHPKMAIMLDIESWGGQIRGNQSAGINAAFEDIAAWLGDRRRVFGYGNVGDLNSIWPQKPEGIRLVVAAYGSNPSYPGKIAHQYTNGEGYGARDGLPDGAAPFGKCDMNSADGLTATQFAAALGISVTTEEDDDMAKVPQDQWDRVYREQTQKHPSRSPLRHLDEGVIDTWCGIDLNVDGNVHVVAVKALAEMGHQPSIALLSEVAGADPIKYPDRQEDRALALLTLNWVAKVNPQALQTYIDSQKA